MADNKKPPMPPDPDNYGMPENWTPVDAPPIIPGMTSSIGAPPTPSGRDQYNSGALPPNFGLSPDLVKTSYGGGVGEIRLMPVQGGPGDNAKTVSIVTQAINAIPPTVIPPATPAVGDGLIHGESIWWLDPAFIWYRDDFKLGTVLTTTATGASTIGDLGWDGVLSVAAGASSEKAAGIFPHTGAINIRTATTASTVNSLYWPQASITNPQVGTVNSAMPLLDYPGWRFVWIFGFPTQRTTGTVTNFPLLKKQFYCGLSTAAGTSTWTPSTGVNARPQYFIGLRFDTDTTSPSIGDTTFNFETIANPNVGSVRNNTQGVVQNTSITPTEDSWYRFEISCVASGQVTMTLSNGATTFSHTFSNITKMTSIGNVASLSLSFFSNNGKGEVQQAGNATATTSNLTMSLGTIMTISGASSLLFNGTFVVNDTGLTTQFLWNLGGNNITELSSAATITYYPGLIPYFAFGNDTQVGPASAEIAIDFFSFVWNSGLATTPTPLNQNFSRWVSIANT